MSFLPEKFLFVLPLRVGGAVLGVISIIISIIGLCGSLESLDEAIDILGHETFTIRSLCVITLVVSIVYLFAVYSRRSLIMLPAIIWYLAFAVAAVFYSAAAMVLTLYSLLSSSKKSIDGRWFMYEFCWLVSIVIITYFSIIAITLFIRTQNYEKHPRKDTHPSDDIHSPSV